MWFLSVLSSFWCMLLKLLLFMMSMWLFGCVVLIIVFISRCRLLNVCVWLLSGVSVLVRF